MLAYDGLQVLYGDLHNHCDISYGRGSLEQALTNARQQLDFCSVTGHALWPDMPEADQAIQHIMDYHREGFARLRERWQGVQRTLAAQHQPGEFVTFLSFEMHCSADGDYTVLYNGSEGDILEAEGLLYLQDQLRALRSRGTEVLAFPHHIAYRRGQRGINWDRFDETISPVVEIISMHGCSEADETSRPFLHVMGPADHESSMQYGLSQGHFFGVIGSTDHHGGHPGSYGHGRMGVWATTKTRAAIWDALLARRCFALTGDRIALQFTINGRPMGTRLEPASRRQIAFRVQGGAPLDYVDLVKNGQLLRRWSRCDMQQTSATSPIETKLYLEVGWGERGRPVDWEVEFGISGGRTLGVEPRFRGPEIVDPTRELRGGTSAQWTSRWEVVDPQTIRFRTRTFGNPNAATAATQGVCLHVQMPLRGIVQCAINGRRVEQPLARLLDGARAGRLGKIGSSCYRFHRAPLLWEIDWHGEFDDTDESSAQADVYTLRACQLNDQWAWSSPIAVGGELTSAGA